jgi:hypothetical protein
MLRSFCAPANSWDQYLVKHEFVKRLHARFNQEVASCPSSLGVCGAPENFERLLAGFEAVDHLAQTGPGTGLGHVRGDAPAKRSIAIASVSREEMREDGNWTVSRCDHLFPHEPVAFLSDLYDGHAEIDDLHHLECCSRVFHCDGDPLSTPQIRDDRLGSRGF